MTTFEERFATAQAEIQAAHNEMNAFHADFDVEFEKAQAEIEEAHKVMDAFHADFDAEFSSGNSKNENRKPSSAAATRNVAIEDSNARREQLRLRFF